MKHLAALVLAVLAGACGKDAARAPDVRAADGGAAVGEVRAPAADAAPPTGADAAAATITLSLKPSGPRTPGLATRCSLDGAPLGSACRLDGNNLAIDSDGRIYVVDTAGVRRFQAPVADASDAGACALALDTSFGVGGVLTIPEMTSAPQVIGKGPVHMRSGGPSWELAAGPRGVVYAYDFLLGVHRIDRGKVEPACPALQGVGELVFVGAQAYANRNGVEALTIGKTCKTRPVALEPRPRHGLFVVGGTLAGETEGRRVALYGAGGAATAQLGADDAHAPGGACSVMAVVACGDDVCVVDHNCKKVPRYGRDGAYLRTHDFAELFTDSPYVVSTAVTGTDGSTWFSTAHQDGAACEGAVYRVPPGAWAP